MHKDGGATQPISKALLPGLPSRQAPLVPLHIHSLRLELIMQALDQIGV